MAYTYDPDNIFAKILRGEIPNKTVLETEHSLAFEDIQPQAPVHVLVIPRKEIRNVDSLEDEDASLMGHLFCVARELARSLGLSESGYRLVINNGQAAGQTVWHLHVHLLGGRQLSWPPG